MIEITVQDSGLGVLVLITLCVTVTLVVSLVCGTRRD